MTFLEIRVDSVGGTLLATILAFVSWELLKITKQIVQFYFCRHFFGTGYKQAWDNWCCNPETLRARLSGRRIWWGCLFLGDQFAGAYDQIPVKNHWVNAAKKETKGS